MKKSLSVLVIAAAALLIGGGSSALADKPVTGTCTGGTIPAGGTYDSFTVTGSCRFGGSITINGNLTIANGAALNAHASGGPGTVLIGGNVIVGQGATLGLGSYNPVLAQTTTVNGSIVANAPLDLYLSFITVHGNVISNGGGPGTSEFLNFPTKDDTIDGNLVIQGWTGGWIGIIRDHVGGNVIFSNNASVTHQVPDGCGPPPMGDGAQCTLTPGADPDSSEVDTNTIGGNLICQGNSPVAQLGDATENGGIPSTVGGNKIGQCAGL